MIAAKDAGFSVENSGRIPSPALAYYGLTLDIPTVMVTGSHIPDDRNGIKYTSPAGEISKEDEQGIREQEVALPAGLFDAGGMLRGGADEPAVSDAAAEAYVSRYSSAFPADLLRGRTLALYEHSAVGRDLLARIHAGAGAEVVRLGRSDRFVPVDTEAVREEDVELARRWAAEGEYMAVLSSDGDSDRPLLSDERGRWVRGDILGILCAEFLRADAVVAPVSCNSALEQCGLFKRVYRTRIGSPYVIAGMDAAAADGFTRVVGYEANGGFLHRGVLDVPGGTLRPLPTRDAALVHLAVLSLALARGCTVSELCAQLPARYTASDRLKGFPTERSAAVVAELAQDAAAAERAFGALCGGLIGANSLDGLRMTFSQGDVIHLRASGNAPEFRCYTESSSQARAEELLQAALVKMEGWRKDAPA